MSSFDFFNTSTWEESIQQRNVPMVDISLKRSTIMNSRSGLCTHGLLLPLTARVGPFQTTGTELCVSSHWYGKEPTSAIDLERIWRGTMNLTLSSPSLDLGGICKFVKRKWRMDMSCRIFCVLAFGGNDYWTYYTARWQNFISVWTLFDLSRRQVLYLLH